MKKLEQYKEIHALIRHQKDDFGGFYTLDIVDKDDNIILSDKNKFASGPAAQGYFENNYLAKHKAAKKPKIKIESVQVFAETDESPDTSTFGKYTNKDNDWNIDRKANAFVYKVQQRARIIEALQERIDDESAAPNYMVRMQHRIDKLEQSRPDDCYISSGEYRYFEPYAGGEKPGSADYKKNAWQDYERMESLNDGHWSYIGIIAKAKILIDGQYQTISSGGLWGVESDGGKEYLDDTIEEQLNHLAGQLEALGIGKRAIQYAIKQCDRELIYK